MMKKNERAVATNNGSILRTEKRTKKSIQKENRFAMSNSTTTLKEIQIDFRFAGQRLVCDECARPLHLYGENFVETYTGGKVNVLRCLCDLHAEEMGVNT